MAQIRMRFRGSGFKHTLPYLWHYSNIWFLVFLVSGPGTFVGFLLSDVLTDEGREAVRTFLITRMPIVMVAVILLAVMLTTRLAGPFVALKRAFADVAEGNMSRRLKFRTDEKCLDSVADGFNTMMDTVERTVQEHRDDPQDAGGDAESPQERSAQRSIWTERDPLPPAGTGTR